MRGATGTQPRASGKSEPRLDRIPTTASTAQRGLERSFQWQLSAGGRTRVTVLDVTTGVSESFSRKIQTLVSSSASLHCPPMDVVPVGTLRQLLPGSVLGSIQPLPLLPRKLPQPRAPCSGRRWSEPHPTRSRMQGSALVFSEDGGICCFHLALPISRVSVSCHYSACIRTSVLE